MVGWLGSHFQAQSEERIYERRKHLVFPNLVLQTTAWVDGEHVGKEAAQRVTASRAQRVTASRFSDDLFADCIWSLEVSISRGPLALSC